MSQSKAFTLAEVLITLGIIGIVSAITIPALITKYRVKVLEAQFKKADAMLQESLKKSVNEFGYDDITDLNIDGRQVNQETLASFQTEIAELNEIWLKQFKGIKEIYHNPLFHQGVRVYDLFGNPLESPKYTGYYFPGNGTYLLPDGTLITGLMASWNGVNHPAIITFIFDTNGPYKGPNRLGHDIFAYSSIQGYLNYCNPNIQNSGHQKGCYDWAHKNLNPLTNSGEYWDILFKPISYWEK